MSIQHFFFSATTQALHPVLPSAWDEVNAIRKLYRCTLLCCYYLAFLGLLEGQISELLLSVTIPIKWGYALKPK